MLRAYSPGLSGASILMYHSIGDNKAFFTVRPDMFDTQMRYLKERGFSVVPLRALIKKMQTGESVAGYVAITFDDGYKDNFDIALPILKKYGFPATIFVISGLIGQARRYISEDSLDIMTADDMRFLGHTGLIDVMPHSVSHRKLAKVAATDAIKEIENSRAAIESITGASADIFAFPKGSFSQELSLYLRDHGWAGAITVREGIVKADDDVFTLKRNSIDSSTTMLQFKAKVSDAIAIYSKFKLLR